MSRVLRKQATTWVLGALVSTFELCYDYNKVFVKCVATDDPSLTTSPYEYYGLSGGGVGIGGKVGRGKGRGREGNGEGGG